jgi:hypothetical protein
MRLPDDFLARVFRRVEELIVDLQDLAHGIGHGKDRVLVNGALVGFEIGVRTLDFAKRLAQPRDLRPRQPQDRLQHGHGHQKAQNGRDGVPELRPAVQFAFSFDGGNGLDQPVRLHPVLINRIL